jgi:hypothetical protein
MTIFKDKFIEGDRVFILRDSEEILECIVQKVKYVRYGKPKEGKENEWDNIYYEVNIIKYDFVETYMFYRVFRTVFGLFQSLIENNNKDFTGNLTITQN